MPVDLLPEAVDEAAEAYDWYATRSGDAADRFADALDAAIAAVGDDPSTYAEIQPGFRFCPLGRFPYLLIHRETGGRVQVVAVAHARRRPGYWHGRIE